MGKAQVPTTIDKPEAGQSTYIVSGTATLIATERIILGPGSHIQSGSTFNAHLIPDAYLSITKSDENYIFTRSYQSPMASVSGINENGDALENITYFDGLGRPMQRLGIKASPTKKDIITHFDHDAYGRQEKQWLPYSESSGSLGSYRGDVSSATQQYYQTNYGDDFTGMALGDINAFSQKDLETSSLSRVRQQAAPGKDWKLGNGHEIKFDYETNATNEVRHFTVGFVSGDTENPQLNGGSSYYPTGELYKNVTKDENWSSGTDHTTEEFTNKQGQVVLKRAHDNGDHDTYYVYDDYGNLTYVIPPKVTTASVSATELDGLCYQYRYDHRNRLTAKKIPGKDWEYILYNDLDQPILTQDALQRPNKEWLFTKYDAFGRVVYTGVYTHASVATPAQLQAAMDTYYTNNPSVVRYEEKQTSAGSYHYYSNTAYPTTGLEVLTVNYYDNYTFDLDGGSNPGTVYGQTLSTDTKGMSTGTKVKVLDTSDWITTVSYYDAKGRPVFVHSRNDYLNTTDITETLLDFAGKPLTGKTSHTRDGNAAIVTVDTYTYDHTGRLLTQDQDIDGLVQETIVDNTYDDLGQLITKEVGGGLQEVNYTYNVRGWLKAINEGTTTGADLFGFKINYNTTTENLGAAALYNGNISETIWETANDNTKRAYGYQYDALNRVTAGKYSLNTNYDISGIGYDKNGNITALQRRGHTNGGATTFGIMDNLVYSYANDGNRLTKVLDNGHDDHGFVDGSDTATEYGYDLNGNMTMDLNKDIQADGIAYNHLNLPVEVKFDNNNSKKITYIYDATGTKLQKTVTEPGPSSMTTDYAGNYIYEGSTLQFFNHAEGYVEPNGSGGYDHIYQYKDHLGNIRLSYKDVSATPTPSLEIQAEKNYYPFGLEHKGYNNVVNGTENNYQTFQGKEHQQELGLETYDFGFRAYDPAIARWTVIDPLAERRIGVTPYNFVQNSPMFRIDPDGLTDFKLNKKTGDVEQVGDENDDPDRIVRTDKNGNVKKKGEGFLGFLVKKSERGKAKVDVSGIEKGILKDGQNLKTQDNVIDVGGEGQPTLEGVRDFALKLANHLDVEIGGFDLSKKGEDKISHVFLGGYEGNDAQEANTGLNLRIRPDLFGTTTARTAFHTHLSRFGDSDRLRPSGQDLKTKKNTLRNYPDMKFLILTNPNNKPY